jgi:murein DD-endopeptidase MepM/ murein hydrolase activator NlpD
MEDVLANVSSEKLWSGKFTSPLKVKLEKLYSYGEHITMNVEHKERAYCNIYAAPADSAVVAVNSGKVVYAGETSITGKLVVIEHGFGLKSWYWNLGSVDVKVGDEIGKGKQLGTVGNSGLCDEAMTVLSFAMSVGDVYFKPDLYFNGTVDYFDK